MKHRAFLLGLVGALGLQFAVIVYQRVQIIAMERSCVAAIKEVGEECGVQLRKVEQTFKDAIADSMGGVYRKEQKP